MKVLLARFGTPIQFGISAPTTQVKAGDAYVLIFTGSHLHVKEIRTGCCVCVPTANIAYMHTDSMPSADVMTPKGKG
jgi:hypothetical protein